MSVGELLSQGGWSMYPIYFCSLVALAMFLRKAWEIKQARLQDMGWFEQALSAYREQKETTSILNSSPHPGAKVVSAALQVAQKRPDRAEAEAKRVGSLELQRLEAGLALLSFIAQVAPLLGLLGTVLGMVELFLGLQGSGLSNVNVSALSAGIWKALLTTAAGLMVAVPALAAHSYLTSRTDSLRLQLTDVIQRLLNETPEVKTES